MLLDSALDFHLKPCQRISAGQLIHIKKVLYPLFFPALFVHYQKCNHRTDYRQNATHEICSVNNIIRRIFHEIHGHNIDEKPVLDAERRSIHILVDLVIKNDIPSLAVVQNQL